MMRRRRKVDSMAMVWTLILSLGLGAERALAGVRRLYQRTTGAPVVPSTSYARRRLRDDDRLPGSGIASLTRGAASDGELPEPRNGDRLAPCERVGDGANHPLGGSPGLGGMSGGVQDELGHVHVVPPSSYGWNSEDGARPALSVPRLGSARNQWCVSAQERLSRHQIGCRWIRSGTTGSVAVTVSRESNGNTWRDSVVVRRTPWNPGR